MIPDHTKLSLKKQIYFINWLITQASSELDWREEEKGTTEDETVGWHHWLNGHEFEQAPGAGDGQGCLACHSPWGGKESDTTERLNWTEPIPLNYTQKSHLMLGEEPAVSQSLREDRPGFE